MSDTPGKAKAKGMRKGKATARQKAAKGHTGGGKQSGKRSHEKVQAKSASAMETKSKKTTRDTRPATTTTLKVHRLQCVQYQPQAINCITFQRGSIEAVSGGTADGKRHRRRRRSRRGRTSAPEKPQQEEAATALIEKCAIARADATIEIWNVTAGFVLEQVLPGGSELSVESMFWIGDRLVTAGVYSNIFEWSVSASTITTQHDSYGGPVFSMALNHEENAALVGCEDGSVRLYAVSASEGMEFQSTISKHGGRVLCMAWSPDDASIAVGDDQGGIRVLTRTGKILHRLSLQDSALREKVCVWSVIFHSANTLASASSRGDIQFWNVLHGVESQCIRAHNGPALALAKTATGELFSTGVDAKLAMFKQAQEKRGFEIASLRRELSRDCRALAVSPSGGDILCGGLDTSLLRFDPREFGDPRASHRTISSLPQMAVASMSETSPLGCPILCSSSKKSITIWAIAEGKRASVVDGDALFALQLRLTCLSNIQAVAVSRCGTFVAASSLDGVRVFKLALGADGVLEAEKVGGTSFLSSAREMKFTHGTSEPSRRLVCLSCSGSLEVFSLMTKEVARITFSQKLRAGGTQARCHLSLSSDDQWAVVSANEAILWFSLDTQNFHGMVRTQSLVTAISFVPKTNNVLVVTADKILRFYDTEKCLASKWSREAGAIIPAAWASYQGVVFQVSFCSKAPTRAVLVTQSGILFVDTTKRITSKQPSSADSQDNPEKRAKPSMEPRVLKIGQSLTRYKPLLFARLASPTSLVVVERPWLAVESALPAPIARHKYGS